MSFRAPSGLLALLLLCALPASAGPSPAPTAEEVLERLRQVESARLRGRAEAVRRELEEQARAHPNDAMLRVYKAWLSFPSDTCWNELKAASVFHPANPWLPWGMGLVYVRWGLLEEAGQQFAAVQRVAPDFVPRLWGEALLLQARGKTAEAEALLRQALEKLDAPQIRASLGLLVAGQPGREAEALALLEKAVQGWPDQPEALEKLARLARAAQATRTAAEAGEKLVALRPKDKEAHRLQAELWQAVGEREKAARSIESYIALGGSEPAVLATLARLYAELGKAAEEEKSLERLVGVDTQDAEPRLRLAELAEARGDMAATEQWLGRAVELAPKRSDIHVRRARLLSRQERVREALEAYRTALAAPERRVPEAEAEAAELVKRLRLPSTKARGTQDKIYSRVSLGLVALYTERLKEKPGLKGILKVRVRVDAAGRATQVQVVQDTLQDALVADHAYFAFLDAEYTPGASEYSFQYVFRPPK